MREIRLIGCDELVYVQQIVFSTWPDTYGAILSAVQIEYMLEKFYNLPVLEKSVKKGYLYYVFFENDLPLGFMAVQPDAVPGSLKVHKLYILPNHQGKKIGSGLFTQAETIARNHGMKRIYLNVNRFNNAVSFYHAMGMRISGEEDIDIGNGYLMEDFVMEKDL